MEPEPQGWSECLGKGLEVRNVDIVQGEELQLQLSSFVEQDLLHHQLAQAFSDSEQLSMVG